MRSRHRFTAVFVTVGLLVGAACGSSPDSHPSLGGANGASSSTGGHAGGSTTTLIIDLDGSIQVPDGSTTDYDGSTSTEAGTVCGNGLVEANEECDDANAIPGDGCDGTCHLERGYCCGGDPAASGCGHPVRCAAVCGNGSVEAGEACDDSTTTGTSGCSATCQVVKGWSCPAAGGACTYTGYCGDGVVQSTAGEQCDDHTNDGQHGCSTTCTTLKGWKCPSQGGACGVDAYCGNGTVDPGEECDDHNLRSYDGCSSTCFIETGWSCPSTGGACTHICGNGIVDSGEQCDDGNAYSGDGCSSACKQEKNYTCTTPGSPCVYTPPPPPAQCGNGLVETGELCDDGNTTGGDGCSAVCESERGWVCRTANAPCVAASCGDGIVAGAEKCDDGTSNGKTNDGCNTDCTIKPNATCSVVAGGGTSCIPMQCGDGNITGIEQCDDGNHEGGDGCSADCLTIEPGWVCPVVGKPCTTDCGDNIVAGREQCDEGPSGAACCTTKCTLVPGYVCDPNASPHSQDATKYCGNHTVNGPSGSDAGVDAGLPARGQEDCDDGNLLAFDGCGPTCKNEPHCGTYAVGSTTAEAYKCFARCGDGIVMAPEQCDDGNTQSGDGCSSTCQLETGWKCGEADAGTQIDLPVVWRDFTEETHPQFEISPDSYAGRMPGIAQPNLVRVPGGIPNASAGAAGALTDKYVPKYNQSFSLTGGGANFTMNGPGWTPGRDVTCTGTATPAYLTTPDQISAAYAQWYVDDPNASPINLTYPGTITMTSVAGGFRYSCDDTACGSTFRCSTAVPRVCTAVSSHASSGANGFFPLDGVGWPTHTTAPKETLGNSNHNYHFTTETRYWFTFEGGETLSFFGDDDVWVFVNGQLVVDIGGIHGKVFGQFTLPVPDVPDAGGTTTISSASVCYGTTECSGANTSVPLTLEAGKVYEIAVFNAERHVTGSNFQLTLKGFNSSPTVCTANCGDGNVVGPEQCDRGSANVDPSSAAGTYGQCTTDCKLGPFCGDRVQNGGEACDNGINTDSWVATVPTSKQCGAGCLKPSYCGDGKTQAAFGEQCDEGTGANGSGYGHCQANCKLGPRCGDGQIQAQGETCDDGPNNGAPSSACATNCKLKCGNGTLDSGEDCDDGAANGTSTSTCDTSCQFKCGNGQLEAGEQCDDGVNDGAYGTCNPNCTLAPFCGDGTAQNPPEICDNGAANSPTAWGVDSCTDRCLPGGLCGDGIVNGPEKCDDGKNTGLPGSCTADCSAYVPPASCGDGTVQAPEQCDDGQGTAGNGTSASKCDTSCRFKCGNGVIDSGETCDDGVNDGSYGTCTTTCQVGSYCSDGKKEGPEECDNGSSNVSPTTAYGTSVCTTACTWAPFCGDGRIQAQFGEECEGNVNCDSCRDATVAK